MKLAIFDLDNTLIAGDSDHAWGEFLVEQGLVDAQVYKEANDKYYQAYLDGSLDIEEYLGFSLKPLTQLAPATLEKLHTDFMRNKIQPMMLPKAQALLAQHQQAGDTLLIITATNRFITQPIAQTLGVAHLIAPEPEQDSQGRYTGRITGIPSFREGKVERLKLWLAEQKTPFTAHYFYSDSHNDLPLLLQVDHPVAVDADAKLSAYAQAQGWPHISLRDA